MKQSLCHCTKLRMIAQQVTRLYDEALIESGLKVTQYRLLRHIHSIETPNLAALADAMDLDRSTLGRNVRVLERAGLVELANGRDARKTVLKITDLGQRAFEIGRKNWADCQTSIEQALGKDTHAQLAKLATALEVLEKTTALTNNEPEKTH